MVYFKVKRLAFFFVIFAMIAVAEPGVAAFFDKGTDIRRYAQPVDLVRQQAHASCVSILDIRIAEQTGVSIITAREIADDRCRLLTGLPPHHSRIAARIPSI